MVEMTGVEPVSENNLLGLSTNIADVLKFLRHSAQRQAQCLSSFLVMTEVKAFFSSRSPLSHALCQAAVLLVRTATYLVRLRTPFHNCNYS